AGKLHVDRQVGVVIERDRVLAGADRTREQEMAFGQDRLEGGGEVLRELAPALLAEMREQRAQPLGVALVDRDLAEPFLVSHEVLVGLGQVSALYQGRVL